MAHATQQLDNRSKRDVESAGATVFAGAQHLLCKKRPILLVEIHNPQDHRKLTRKFSEIGHLCRDLDDACVLALPQ